MPHTAWWSYDSRTLDSPTDVEDLFATATTTWYSNAVKAIRILIGPAGTDETRAPLQVDIDIDEGRAHVRWRPDDTLGFEEGAKPHHRSLRVHIQSDEPLATLEGADCLVTPGYALRAVEEYTETGARPGCLGWRPY
ncbi:Imm1 family immunity protein [Phytomonospora endophytica]|uniref:Imm1 family immunity protein n=1 Tax=Phytomonospora endophytica TaxID=714109 RepID=UPI001617B27C|nr:Imm1 family immunity protein [Phytomonospora endophytica]